MGKTDMDEIKIVKNIFLRLCMEEAWPAPSNKNLPAKTRVVTEPSLGF